MNIIVVQHGIAIGGALFVAGTGLLLATIAAGIGAGLTTDGYLTVIPMLPVLESIGPAILGFVIFRLPKREELWRPGLWVVSVLGGWSLFGIVLSGNLIHTNTGAVLVSLLLASTGLMLIYMAKSACPPVPKSSDVQ